MSENVDDVSASLRHFGVFDYAVFLFMLIACSIVGLYFGYKDHKQSRNNAKASKKGSESLNFLLGGKNMKIFPVAMSLVASYISGITLLGTSTEIYVYGTQYAFILAGPAMMGIFNYFVFIPVFYDLQVVSMFEYLQRRFDMKMRLFGSITSSIATILYLSIVIFVPALAFNQMTGINIHLITIVVMSVCMFYTSLGGLKAVVWTDVIQIVIMYGVLTLIIIKGTLDVGGLGVVAERNWMSGRFEAPDLRIDPTIRHSFWTLFLGGSCYWIIINSNQIVIQRFLALKNQRAAQKGSVIFVLGVTILICMCIYNGLLLYATFHDCDPLTTKLAKAKDQMLPLLVMKTFKNIPGLSGLFIAGVFSAALSSLSTGLNSMSALVLEDYIKPFNKRDLSERASGFIMRGTVLVSGIISVAMVYFVEHMGQILQLSMSVPPALVGGIFGVFLIGMFMPWIGKKAAFYGVLFSSAVMVYIVIRSQLEMADGLITYDPKVTSVEGCTYNFTLPQQPLVSSLTVEIEKKFHHISYLYYMPLGAAITCIASFILSLFIGFEDPKKADPKLLAPFMRNFVKISVVENIQEMKQDERDT